MKMMALAQKVQGDVAVGDETAGNDDEVEEGVFDKDGMLGKFVKTDTGTDVTTGEPNAPTFMGFNVATRDKKIEGLKNAIKIAQSNDGSGRDWKKGKVPTIKDVPRLRAELAKLEKEKAMQGESVEDIEEADFEKNFKKRVGYTVRGGAASDMMKQQAAQAQANNPDAGTGLGPSVLNIPKAREKAAKRGITAPGNLRASPNTRDPKRLPEGWAEIDTSSLTKEPGDKIFTLTLSKTGEEYKVPGKDIIDAFQKFKELYWNKNKSLIDINDVDEFAGNRLLASKFSEALDHDIKIGDTVETKKMGQMQGVVTGFSTKSGDTRVMFKHKSGKVYATPASNLKVIDTVKKTESQVAENIELRHDLQPGTYKHKLQNIQVSIDNNGSVTFMQPAQWEIEGDQEYLEYVESQLAMPEYWDAELDEAKKKPVPTDPSKWSYYKSQAKKKFDVYPSAYANAWAAKQYKAAGGGWRMGKPKK
jgi:hypothetical protein